VQLHDERNVGHTRDSIARVGKVLRTFEDVEADGAVALRECVTGGCREPGPAR